MSEPSLIHSEDRIGSVNESQSFTSKVNGDSARFLVSAFIEQGVNLFSHLVRQHFSLLQLLDEILYLHLKIVSLNFLHLYHQITHSTGKSMSGGLRASSDTRYSITCRGRFHRTNGADPEPSTWPMTSPVTYRETRPGACGRSRARAGSGLLQGGARHPLRALRRTDTPCSPPASGTPHSRTCDNGTGEIQVSSSDHVNPETDRPGGEGR